MHFTRIGGRVREKAEKALGANGADGISNIEHVASEGMERFGESDIEGKAAMGSGESIGKRMSFNRAGRRQRSWVAGARSPRRPSDQGNAARVAAKERG